MSSDIIRKKFIEHFGKEKYKEFVLSLYESFPIRNKLFFWQEQLLEGLSVELNCQKFSFEEVYLIFNHCPLHDDELKEDSVPIVDGSKFQNPIPIEKELELFPFANIEAYRNFELRNYPQNINVFFCPKCRNERILLTKLITYKIN